MVFLSLFLDSIAPVLVTTWALDSWWFTGNMSILLWAKLVHRFCSQCECSSISSCSAGCWGVMSHPESPSPLAPSPSVGHQLCLPWWISGQGKTRATSQSFEPSWGRQPHSVAGQFGGAKVQVLAPIWDHSEGPSLWDWLVLCFLFVTKQVLLSPILLFLAAHRSCS